MQNENHRENEGGVRNFAYVIDGSSFLVYSTFFFLRRQILKWKEERQFNDNVSIHSHSWQVNRKVCDTSYVEIENTISILEIHDETSNARYVFLLIFNG